MTSPTDSPIRTLLRLMAELRDPERGCAWDVAQTFDTIVPYTIEEAYEVADAVARGDRDDLRDELGDLLLQVVFHARMAEEEGAFAFDDVARAITAKLIRRHPHVFAADGTLLPAGSPGGIRRRSRRSGRRSRRLSGRPSRRRPSPRIPSAASPGLCRPWRGRRRSPAGPPPTASTGTTPRR